MCGLRGLRTGSQARTLPPDGFVVGAKNGKRLNINVEPSVGFLSKRVGETGFEPATLWSQTRCATRLRYSPIRLQSNWEFLSVQVSNAKFCVCILYRLD